MSNNCLTDWWLTDMHTQKINGYTDSCETVIRSATAELKISCIRTA